MCYDIDTLSFSVLRYSLERKTFGKPIAQHQAIAFMIAGAVSEEYGDGGRRDEFIFTLPTIVHCLSIFSDMATGVEASRLLTYKSAWMVDSGMR